MVGAFFYRAYLHLFISQGWIPCDEIINYITINNLVKIGQPVNLSYYPQGMHFLIYGIWMLFLGCLNPEVLCKFFNPFVSALTVPVFYLLLRQFVDKENALLSSVVFAFCEAHLYRSANFGSSETLGFLLMLTSFYLYIKKKYIPSIISLAIVYEVHLLPFFFGFAVLSLNTIVKYWSKKTLLILGSFTSVVLGLFYTNMFPYQRQLGFISPTSFITRVNFGNVILFSLNELVTYGLIFSGSVLVVLISTWSFKKSNSFTKIWLLTAITSALILLITYSALTLGPYRLLIYISVGFVLLYSFVKIPFKKLVTVIIIIVMFISPFLGGWQLIFRAYDTVTQEEIQAIEWAVKTQNTTYIVEGQPICLTNSPFIAADYPIIEYWNLYLLPSSVLNSTFDYKTYGAHVNVRNDYLEGNQSLEYLFYYVFLSDRMEKNAFFEEWKGIRTFQYHQPVSDRWFNNPNWEQIYNVNDVKIYRRISDVVT